MYAFRGAPDITEYRLNSIPTADNCTNTSNDLCNFATDYSNAILFTGIKGETSAPEPRELIRKKLIGAGVQNGGSQVILMLRHT